MNNIILTMVLVIVRIIHDVDNDDSVQVKDSDAV